MKKTTKKTTAGEHIKVSETDGHDATTQVSNFLLETDVANRRPVMTLVYATWCHFCNNMRPAWDTIVSPVRMSGIHVVEIDSSSMSPMRGQPPCKLASLAKNTGVPHIVLIQPDDNVNVYSGDRSKESLLDFVANANANANAKAKATAKANAKATADKPKLQLNPKAKAKANAPAKVTADKLNLQLNPKAR